MRRGLEAMARAAGVQDPLVERGVVGRQEFRARDERSNRRPQRSEVGRSGDVAPRQSVDSSEHELPGRRPNEVDRRIHYLAVGDLDEADRAGAVAPIVRGLEIDRDEVPAPLQIAPPPPRLDRSLADSEKRIALSPQKSHVWPRFIEALRP